MDQKQQSWSIIIFCYNEAGNIFSVIDKSLHFLKTVSPHKNELIIVDDGSSDETLTIANKYADEYANVKVIAHKTNLGIGHALRSGYHAAQYENICAIPGDGQFDAAELAEYGEVPDRTIIAFYRKDNLQYSIWRDTLSYINRRLNEMLFGINIRDVNWIKIYKREELKDIQLNITSSLVESEICAKLIYNGNKLVEVPSKYLERNFGVDKGASLKIVWQALKDIIALAIEVTAFKRSKGKTNLSSPYRKDNYLSNMISKRERK